MLKKPRRTILFSRVYLITCCVATLAFAAAIGLRANDLIPALVVHAVVVCAFVAVLISLIVATVQKFSQESHDNNRRQ